MHQAPQLILFRFCRHKNFKYTFVETSVYDYIAFLRQVAVSDPASLSRISSLSTLTVRYLHKKIDSFYMILCSICTVVIISIDATVHLNFLLCLFVSIFFFVIIHTLQTNHTTSIQHFQVTQTSLLYLKLLPFHISMKCELSLVILSNSCVHTTKSRNESV